VMVMGCGIRPWADNTINTGKETTNNVGTGTGISSSTRRLRWRLPIGIPCRSSACKIMAAGKFQLRRNHRPPQTLSMYNSCSARQQRNSDDPLRFRKKHYAKAKGRSNARVRRELVSRRFQFARLKKRRILTKFFGVVVNRKVLPAGMTTRSPNSHRIRYQFPSSSSTS